MQSARVAEGAQVHEPNELTPAQAAALNAEMQRRLQDQGYRTSPAVLPAGSVTVDVRVHVITRTDGTGALTRKKINRQINVLNNGFSGQTATAASDTPFRFVIKSIDRTANNDWYNWNVFTDNDDAEAKAALHKGGADDLNFYITGLADGLLGYATFPGGDLTTDGLVILNQTMPGGTAAPYNQGDTATHEVGHWLGLYHTFQDGCVAPGDYVRDTPYQDDGDNIYDCTAADTCTAPGKDPVKNFMNYSDDACMNRFTAGQASRMSDAWLAFRDPAA